jgi:hypothetical protein
MNILSLLKNGSGFVGWIKDENKYKLFEFAENKATIIAEKDTQDYKDYETFAAIIGKFDPYMLMIKEPIKIEGLTKEELNRAYESMPKLRTE